MRAPSISSLRSSVSKRPQPPIPCQPSNAVAGRRKMERRPRRRLIAIRQTGRSLRAAGDSAASRRRGSIRTLAMSGDRLDKGRDKRCRNIVAPAGDDLQRRAGRQPRGVSPPFHRHERIVPAMQHKGRRADRLQEIDPAPARQDREHLPADADRIVGAVERAFDFGAKLRLRRRIAGAADDAIGVHAEGVSRCL